MTHAEASMKTKQAMADSLKRYMEVKSLSKITISAICEDCGINRKTFYYHFKDIYDLLKWTLEQESLVVVNQLDVMVDYEKIVLTLLLSVVMISGVIGTIILSITVILVAILVLVQF